MGPTAGSGGLGLIVGVLEGAMGDLVGLRAFPGADSGFAPIPPISTWPTAVSKKEAFSVLEHPVTGGPVGAEIAMRW